MPVVNTKYSKQCFICKKPISYLSIYCSKECKSINQELKIDYICNGCGKIFQKCPHLKRKTNYCTVKCYWNSTRTEEKRVCKVCNKEFYATGSQIRHGFGVYCSRKCQHRTYPKQIKKCCPQCKKIFFIPPSWNLVRTYCSKKCQNDSMRDYVTCVCRNCNKSFEIPRSDFNRGRGTYCGRKCFVIFKGSSLLELKMEKALNLANLKFEREAKFKRFHVDFLIEKYKTIIECDGEYWHLIPITKDRDRRKDILLRELGYKVLRFTGNELDKFTECSLSEILKQQFNY